MVRDWILLCKPDGNASSQASLAPSSLRAFISCPLCPPWAQPCLLSYFSPLLVPGDFVGKHV